MRKMNLLEIKNMGLKEKIGKEVEAHERLSFEIQQNNDVAAKTRWKHKNL